MSLVLSKKPWVSRGCPRNFSKDILKCTSETKKKKIISRWSWVGHHYYGTVRRTSIKPVILDYLYALTTFLSFKKLSAFFLFISSQTLFYLVLDACGEFSNLGADNFILCNRNPSLTRLHLTRMIDFVELILLNQTDICTSIQKIWAFQGKIFQSTLRMLSDNFCLLFC